MDHYKEMYFALFNKITDVIHDLQSVQTEVEELFLQQEPEQQIFILPVESENTD